MSIIDIDEIRAHIDKHARDSLERLNEDGFVFEVSLDDITNGQHNKMSRWMNSYIGYYNKGWNFISFSSHNIKYYFKCEVDAMAFKLRWL